MGLRDDLKRFKEVGEDERQDLEDFIQYGDLGASRPDVVNVPIKIVDLPEFVYDSRDQGGVGQGDGDTPEIGQPVDPEDAESGDGDDGDGEEGQPGSDGDGDHGYYEMDPEEFAEELDEELGLDLDPKGKQVVEEIEGAYKDVTRTGPNSTLDFETLFKNGLKRKLAMDFDEDYVREALKVAGMGPASVFEWARENNINVSRSWLEQEYETLTSAEKTTWDSLDEMTDNVEQLSVPAQIKRDGLRNIPFRREDERYRYPETIEKKEKNVVVVNIRDVSGSMRQEKRELVERTFTPLDWYLTGKYDNAEFVYIAHDAEAWETTREEFFGIQSGGGTRISTAYALAKNILEQRYPWENWNRYVFAAGDSENSGNDTTDNVIPLMEDIPANLHAYVEVQPNGGGGPYAQHAETVESELGDRDNVAVEYVQSPEDVTEAIYGILNTED